MKKILALLACLTVVATTFFAVPLDNNDFMAVKEFEDNKIVTEKIVPEDQHLVDKNAKVWIEYRPAYNEAYFYYDSLIVTYDEAQALNTLLACREDFMKGKNYKSFKRLELDDQKPYKAERGNRCKMIQHFEFAF